MRDQVLVASGAQCQRMMKLETECFFWRPAYAEKVQAVPLGMGREWSVDCCQLAFWDTLGTSTTTTRTKRSVYLAKVGSTSSLHIAVQLLLGTVAVELGPVDD